MKICPMCDGSADTKEVFAGIRAYCLDCGLSTDDWPSTEEAVDAWNHRPTEEALRWTLDWAEKQIGEALEKVGKLPKDSPTNLYVRVDRICELMEQRHA